MVRDEEPQFVDGGVAEASEPLWCQVPEEGSHLRFLIGERLLHHLVSAVEVVLLALVPEAGVVDPLAVDEERDALPVFREVPKDHPGHVVLALGLALALVHVAPCV